MNEEFSFSTQDKLNKYCKEEGNIDLTLLDDTEAINVSHNHVLEMINYCSLGDYQRAFKIVENVKDIFISAKALSEESLAVKVIYYRLRNYFIVLRMNANDKERKCKNIDISKNMVEVIGWVQASFIDFESNPENRDELDSEWKNSKHQSILSMNAYKTLLELDKEILKKEAEFKELKAKFKK